MRTTRITGALAAAFIVAACVPRQGSPAPAPAPAPQPAPRPVPPPPSEPPPPAASWEDAPLSPGDWSYSDSAGTSAASYVAPGGGMVGLMCGGGRIIISIAFVATVPPRSIIVRTTYGERRLPARPDQGQVSSALAVDDPLLDQIAFSRGRFLLQAEGGPAVIAPSWPEPARVIEDCRA